MFQRNSGSTGRAHVGNGRGQRSREVRILSMVVRQRHLRNDVVWRLDAWWSGCNWRVMWAQFMV